MEDNHRLTVVSYNLHGFNQGEAYLKSLCESYDIIFVQEHWLAPFDLDKLRILSDNKICFSSSAMNDIISKDCLIGRPFGGVAVYVNQNFVMATKLIKASDRYIVLQIGRLLLINVYLPCASTVDRVEIYAECLANIMNDIAEVEWDNVIFGGDLNVETVSSGGVGSHLYSFMRDLQLMFVDDKIKSGHKHTFRVDTTGACSMPDHFAVSHNLLHNVCDVSIIDSGINLSDHCPLVLTVDIMSCLSSAKKGKNCNNSVLSFRWDKGDCYQYYSLTYDRLTRIAVPYLLLGDAPMTSDFILNCVNQYYRDIVNTIFDCSLLCIPRRSQDFYKHWWDEGLTLLKEAALRSFDIWSAKGKPRCGVEFNDMKRDKLRYKLGIKEKQRSNANSFTDSLNDALSVKDMDSFWRTWRSKFTNNHLPGVIDGCCDEVGIANRFADVFKAVCVPNSVDKNKEFCSSFNDRFESYLGTHVSYDFINVDLVRICVENLKKGKAAGFDGLMAEHVCFAHPVLLVHMTLLFAILYKHGVVPDDFGRGVVIPLLKNVDGNRFTADNYRGITLSPVISKLFEMVLLSQFKALLNSDRLQFGFKEKSSCSSAIFTFRSVTEYYVNNGCTVCICALDISKAFDRVNHYKLLDVLMDKSLPRCFIAILFDWLTKCFVCVRWGSAYSSWFQISAGVRQGGILSPVLFTIYLDPLIVQLRHLGLGCTVFGEFYGCLLYADDILLMAHSMHAMQTMLEICDRVADEFDIKFNSNKSVAMRVGKRFDVRCAALQLAGSDVKFVNELIYLGVHVLAARYLKFSVEHLRSKFYRVFNCIFSKSKTANSELVTVQLLKSFCLPTILYAMEAICLSSSDIRMLDNCMNRAIYKIFGVRESQCQELIKLYVGLHNVKDVIVAKHCKFIDSLLRNMDSANVLLLYGFNSVYSSYCSGFFTLF